MNTRAKVHFILSGLLMVATGIIMICNPVEALVSIAWLYGVLTLVSGISALVYYISGGRYTLGGTGALFRGITDCILGLLLLLNRYLIADIMPILFALWLTVFGVERIVRSIELKKLNYRPWWAILAVGALSTAVGFAALLSPVMSANLLTVLLGIGFIAQGLGYFLFIIDVKKLHRKVDLSKMDEYIVD